MEPEDYIIHELARHLSYLPHVDEVRFEKMYAPMEDLFAFVRKTQIYNTLLKLRDKTRARMKKVAMQEGFQEVSAPNSVMVPGKGMSQNLTLKSPTWPLAQGTMCSHTKIVSGSILPTKSQVEVPGTEAVASGSLSAGKRKGGNSKQEPAIGTVQAFLHGIFHFICTQQC